MRKRAREFLAWPVYFVAFCFHLLCGFFTWLADWIAGEHAPSHNIVTVLILGWAGFVGFAASRTDPNPTDVFLSPRQAHFNVPHGFSDEQIKIALPAIKGNGCLEAIGAVRTAMKTKVGFDPCSVPEHFDIALSDDLQDMTVSGTAIVGEARKPFTVILQHYPPAIWAGGLVVNEVRLE